MSNSITATLTGLVSLASTRFSTSTQPTLIVPTVTWSTNFGPLTTPFTLPANCLDELWNLKTKGLMPGNIHTYYTQGCGISSCCPSGTPYSRAYEWLSTYYSPAVCPQSYRACVPPPNFTVEVGENVDFCCPIKYGCPGDRINNLGWWACNSAMRSTTTAIVVNNPTDQSIIGIVPVDSIGYLNVAYPIQVRWKTADTTLFHQSATPTSTITPPPTSVLPIPSPTKSSPPSSGGSKPVSSTYIIIIVLAIALIILIAIVSIWLIQRRKRATGGAVVSHDISGQNQHYVQPDVGIVQPAFQPHPQTGYQPGPQPYEKPAELPTIATPYPG